MSKLQLYLKGEFYKEISIKLPIKRNFSFKANSQLRELFIKDQISIFRVQNSEDIALADFDFEIVLIIESKKNAYKK